VNPFVYPGEHAARYVSVLGDHDTYNWMSFAQSMIGTGTRLYDELEATQKELRELQRVPTYHLTGQRAVKFVADLATGTVTGTVADSTTTVNTLLSEENESLRATVADLERRLAKTTAESDAKIADIQEAMSAVAVDPSMPEQQELLRLHKESWRLKQEFEGLKERNSGYLQSLQHEHRVTWRKYTTSLREVEELKQQLADVQVERSELRKSLDDALDKAGVLRLHERVARLKQLTERQAKVIGDMTIQLQELRDQ
jgi:DNA repair exonuclease SbcCD ATPase subunit